MTIGKVAAAVALRFANGAADRRDIVIACDGLKSVVRDKLFPTEPTKRHDSGHLRPEFQGQLYPCRDGSRRPVVKERSGEDPR